MSVCACVCVRERDSVGPWVGIFTLQEIERERGCAVMCLFVLEVEKLKECLDEKEHTDREIYKERQAKCVFLK